MTMSEKLEKYGVKIVKRPTIKPTKKLDLSGIYGMQIVKSETKLVLRTHHQTFKRLADMWWSWYFFRLSVSLKSMLLFLLPKLEFADILYSQYLLNYPQN